MKPLTTLFLLLTAPALALAATIEVPGDYSTIKDAVDAASTGDTVLVHPGTYKENVFVNKELHLISSGGPEVTVIDGQRLSTVVSFQVNPGTSSVLDGFTITNGIGVPSSGSRKGGGLFILNSSPTIRNNIIKFNPSEAIHDYGGGIYAEKSSLVIENNVIHHNTGWERGGGFYCWYSYPVLRNNLIHDNLAENGGGLYLGSHASEVTNNTIWGNAATNWGGGIFCSQYIMDVKNCIIRANIAGSGGAEIYNNSGTLTVTYSNVKGGWPGTGNITGGAQFFSAGLRDFHLKQDPCQPGVVNLCVDAGDPSTPMFDGATRTDGVQDSAVVDMGYHYYAPRTHHVPTDFPTIQQAIDAAYSKDIVIVAPGTYMENVFYKGKSVTVKSSSGPSLTVIDGMQTGSCVSFLSSEGAGSVLMGFKITNGTGTFLPTDSIYVGGGIVIKDASPTIRDNLITGNSAFHRGGGIDWGVTGNPLITNNTISNNITEGYGGGIHLNGYGEVSAHPTVKDNTISGNTATTGGGISVISADNNTSVSGNYIASNSSGVGGGMFLRGFAEVDDNIICGNSAGSGSGGGLGGGVYLYFFSRPLSNNLVCSNIAWGSAPATGGGLYTDSCTFVKLYNCTFSGNSADRAGGMYCDCNQTVEIRNSIFWDNNASSHPEIESPSSVDIQFSDIKGGWTGMGNIDADPLFFDTAAYNYRLSQDPCQPGVFSPCVDAGDPSTLMFDGTTRTDGVQDSGVVDIGFHYPIVDLFNVPADYPTIQQAIDAASAGDTVLVAPGTYWENLSFKGKDITVVSSAGPELTVVDGSQLGSVVLFVNNESALAVLEGFTLTNGSGTLGGYTYGGAINCLASSPTIRKNIISNSTAYAGGGIYCQGECSPLISRNEIKNNTSEHGGGIACGYGPIEPRIEGNLIHDNVTTGPYGGFGGGIYFCLDCYPQIINNTVYNNSAGATGGGLFCVEKSSVEILNTIFWNNTAPDGPEIGVQHSTDPVELTINYSNVEGGMASVSVTAGSTLNWETFMIDQDPSFVDQAGGDGHLTWVSPCINRGTPDGTSSHDVDGDPVDYMGGVDMGADEFTDHHPLEITDFTISAGGGADIDFNIDAGSVNGSQGYAIFGSLIGTSPGTPLPFGLVLPLYWDGWTDFVMNYWNSQFFVDFLGKLDATGQAQAKLWVPGLNPVWIGQTMYYACTLYNPFDFVTNPVAIEVVP